MFVFFILIFQTPTPSLTDSERLKPVAEVRPEPRPLSKSRTLHPLNRQERSQPKQPPQPMVLSQVSMQNKTDEKSEDGSVKNSDIDSSGKKHLKNIDSSGHNMLKMERTKTNLTGIPKKTKYSGGKDTQGMDKKAIGPALHRENTSSIPNKNLVKSVEESLKQDFIISSSDSHKVSDNQNISKDISKSQKGHNVSDRDKSRGHQKDIRSAKDRILPKPSPPSQQYLEGAHSSLAGSSRYGEPMWSQKMAPSPLSSKDGGTLSDTSDLDWLNTVKR